MQKVTYKYNKKTNNIKIINSYEITAKCAMQNYLSFVVPIEKVNRTLDSCINEWIAHNRLYKLGLFKERCKDTDLSMNESLFRRICYWILSRRYFK